PASDHPLCRVGAHPLSRASLRRPSRSVLAVVDVLLQLEEFDMAFVLVQHVIDDLLLRVAHDVVALTGAAVEVDLHAVVVLGAARDDSAERGNADLVRPDLVPEGELALAVDLELDEFAVVDEGTFG